MQESHKKRRAGPGRPARRKGRAGLADRSLTVAALLIAALIGSAAGCQRARDPNTVVMLIESHPTSLDPRVGTDAQSERIGHLLFDSLLERDDNFQLRPALAETWDSPDPLTYRFTLRRDARFHDGRPLTARDVKWTLDSVRDGTVTTVKAAAFRLVKQVETPDDHTVVVRLSEPYASFLWNLTQGAIGIVPQGADKTFGAQPVGSGPFRFVRQSHDEEVLLERNPDYWRGAPPVARVQFKIVPDATVRALELRKGAADIAVNALTADMVRALRREENIDVLSQPGSNYQYLAFNLDDPILKHQQVRQALSLAVNREPLIRHLWRGLARPAASLLPPSHWAYDPSLQPVPYDPARARQLLDEAGFPAGAGGVRFHLTIKTSTDETSRQLAAVVQQQWREVGVALEIRSYEFATYYADIVKGAFQVYTLRWIGANTDPDIFEYCFHSRKFPPAGANRGHYNNPEADRLIDLARAETAIEKRKEYYWRLQRLLNEDAPYVHLWYFDNVAVYQRRLANLSLTPTGDYDFLRELTVAEFSNRGGRGGREDYAEKKLQGGAMPASGRHLCRDREGAVILSRADRSLTLAAQARFARVFIFRDAAKRPPR